VAVYQHDKVSLRYEEAGSGTPVLLFGPGAMNSTVEAWQRLEHFDPMEVYKDDVHLIGMDQRNAGQSEGPLPAERPWESFYEDQAGLLDHLGIDRCILMGCCVGCSFALKFIEQAPQRIEAAVLMQPIGRPAGAPAGIADAYLRWGQELMEKRQDIDQATLDGFVENMWRKHEFVFSVDRDFVRSCQTPMLVLPGNDRAHPHEIGVEVAELAPNAEMVDPWKEPPQAMQDALNRIRRFFVEHQI
jgi:pimeloyl-ACP methyl ester carboxylesterase